MPTAIDANERCTNENTFLLNQSFHPWSWDGRQLKLQMNVPLAYSVYVLDVCLQVGSMRVDIHNASK